MLQSLSCFHTIAFRNLGNSSIFDLSKDSVMKKSVRGRHNVRPFNLVLLLGMMASFTSGWLTGCTDNPEHRAKSGSEEIWFEEQLHDYGEILVDSDGTWSFQFKNLADQAIVINRVRSTCGCTIPAWPREPIEPGASGKITVEYNTATSGTFLKSVFVYSSAANSPVKLQIKGKVIPREE